MLEDLIISQAVSAFLAAIELRPKNSRLRRIALKVYKSIHHTYGSLEEFRAVTEKDDTE